MRPAHIGLALLVAAIWGFNFVVIHLGLGSMPALLLAALRFVVAALPVVLLPRPAVSWPRLVAIGLFLFVGQFALLFTGMAQGMPPGLASVTLQAQGFLTALLAAAVLRERPGPRQIAGIAVAFAGLGVIALSVGEGGVTPLGFGLSLGAAASWAVGNVLLRGAGRVDMLALMVWLSLVPPLPLLCLSLWLDGPAALGAALAGISWVGAGAVLYLAVLATLVGFGLWGQLLKLYPASTVAPFSLLVPIFGTLSAALVLGERFGPLRLLGMALILLGLAVTVLPWPRRLRPRPAAPRP
ncbi:EamA family transporter [Roseomonas sp. BN140053]|uniref:EamA family transporter n=1 Tax=Roseomonas sp. BN140053 TaxID=3391898 RepID=UPI0039E75D0D